MNKIMKRSVVSYLGISLAAIILLAWFGMMGSLYFAGKAQGKAGAVNLAGSLRMQSYRIAMRLLYRSDTDPQSYCEITDRLVSGFEERLTNPRLSEALPDSPLHPLRRHYQKIVNQWHREIRPLLGAYVKTMETTQAGMGTALTTGQPVMGTKNPEALRRQYFSLLDDFVASIDQMVALIEADTEEKIRALRLFEGIPLILTFVITLIVLFFAYKRLLAPLNNLLSCADGLRRGDLSIRANHTGEDEFGLLGRTFNTVLEDLCSLYRDMEDRVREKTMELERSNRSLELLYSTVKLLNERLLSNEVFRTLLIDIARMVGLRYGLICIGDHGASGTIEMISQDDGDDHGKLCLKPDCKACKGQGDTHFFTLYDRDEQPHRIISVPIADASSHHGVLLLEVPPEVTVEPWQIRLLETVAGHIGIAVNMRRQTTEHRRLALLEERGVIARELHDSLAQSLTYLKIQARKIEMLLENNTAKDEVSGVVNEMRQGISSAYRELRELLTTFRLKIDGPGLESVLTSTIEEFRGRSEIEIHLEFRLNGFEFSANEEIHVLQIVREALSNILQHSLARQAEIRITGQNGRIDVCVEDDGIGIPKVHRRKNHYGLEIMQARAQGLGGEIRFNRRASGGTQVRLSFQRQPKEENPSIIATSSAFEPS
ncbi:MAG: HAMP domain-containing protein [Gammaproteobacteria bacterium]|nr:HAMP domain-containing protein [Gammaproteobacteria bacterium]